jgi:maleylacetate reductase
VTRQLNLANNALPWNVVFDSGAIGRLPGEMDRLHFERALVVSTPGRRSQAEELTGLLGPRAAAIFDQAKAHVPLSSVESAMLMADSRKVDCAVSIGGGSTTGLAKALALKAELPIIAIPTSYAGSEMTDIWGITNDGHKTTGRSVSVLPKLVIYDPLLTLHLPMPTTASSGMNALAQAAVNIMETAPDPQVLTMALQAVRLLASSLPVIAATPNDVEARSDALQGACLAGASLGAGVTSLHHRLCHIIGGRFNANHADTHAVLLPHCVAYNAVALPDQASALAGAMGVANAAVGLHNLARLIGAPLTLSSLGLELQDLNTIVDIALESPANNPRTVDRSGLESLLRNAYDGVLSQ